MDSSSSSYSVITTVHPDIIQSHILPRLDGTALAAASSTASHLRHLCTENHLWHKICTATWPSLTDSLANSLISTFPATHRSIFSDSFPTINYTPSLGAAAASTATSQVLAKEVFSAVDLHYKGKPVFSKVIRTETHKGWFLCSPLWIELLEPNEFVSTPVKFSQNDEVLENLTLSWIMIDPTRKRSVNLSSRVPVAVRKHWLTGEVEILYAVVMGLDVQCTIKVTCCGKTGGEMHVREVSLTMEDTEGRHVIGRESMGILLGAMENGMRKKLDVEEVRERFERFCLVKREKRERKMRRERAMDLVVMLVAFAVFALLLSFCVRLT